MAVDRRFTDGTDGSDMDSVRSQVPCRIGLWGLFDTGAPGSMLDALVARRELLRRLPSADVRLFAPFGHLRPSRLDGGEPVEPLGGWTDRRAEQLAHQLDFLVIGPGRVAASDERLAEEYGAARAAESGGPARATGSGDSESGGPACFEPSRYFIEGLGLEREKGTPTAWHAVTVSEPLAPELAERVQRASAQRCYVSVPDEASRCHLQQAGVETEVVVVPEPALLLSRLFPAELLGKRLAYLRLMGWFPKRGETVVVQSGGDLKSWLPLLGAALSAWLEMRPDAAVVLAETGKTADDEEVDRVLGPMLGADRLYHLPAVVGSEDVIAAIAACETFAGATRLGSVTAASFGRPALLDTQPPIGDVTGLKARVDAHFDRLAELAITAFADHRGAGRAGTRTDDRVLELEARLAALRRAHEVRGHRLTAERSAYADQVADLRRELSREQTELDRARRQLNSEVPRRILAESELKALRATRTFRWTALARAVYRRVRGSG